MQDETFKSLKVSRIAAAFALAHRYSLTAPSPVDRKRFRQIAKIIWDACGEEKTMPVSLPENLAIMADLEAL